MENHSQTYRLWAEPYELFEGEAALETWRMGVVAELRRLGSARHRILDLGAGTGIGRRALLEAFPEAEVVSLDRSPEMLRQGGIPADQAIVADMADFETSRESFDYVVSGFDALNCMSAPQLAGCLECVARTLRPGGRMVFDYSTRKMLKYDWQDLELVREVNGIQLTFRHCYEPLFDRTRVVVECTGGAGSRWREVHYHYSVDPFLLHELAMTAGLDVHYCRNIDDERFSPSHTTHLWVLQRPVEARA